MDIITNIVEIVQVTAMNSIVVNVNVPITPALTVVDGNPIYIQNITDPTTPTVLEVQVPSPAAITINTPTPSQLIINDNVVVIDSIPSSKILPSVGTIPPFTTGIVESIPYAGFFSARYFVALQAASGKTSSFDYSITTDNAGDIFEAIFGKIPGTLNYNVISIVVGSNINFTIHNNESTILTWKVQKLSF